MATLSERRKRTIKPICHMKQTWCFGLICCVLVGGCVQWKDFATGPGAGNSLLSLATESQGPAEETPRDTRRAQPTGSELSSELALARLREQHGNTDDARRLYLSVVKQEPRNPLPYHRLAVLAAQEGDFKVAHQYFREAQERQTPSAELLCNIGYTYFLEGRSAEAEKHFRNALELDENYAAAHNNLGLVLGEQGRFEQSLTAFRRANDEAAANANLAFVYAQRGELGHALDMYNRALTLNDRLAPAAHAMVQFAQLQEGIKQKSDGKPSAAGKQNSISGNYSPVEESRPQQAAGRT